MRLGKFAPDLDVAVGALFVDDRIMSGFAYIYREFDVAKAELPPQSAADVYIITGSASAVHDADTWNVYLGEWLVRIDRTIPLVGICFDHQIMAEA